MIGRRFVDAVVFADSFVQLMHFGQMHKLYKRFPWRPYLPCCVSLEFQRFREYPWLAATGMCAVSRDYAGQRPHYGISRALYTRHCTRVGNAWSKFFRLAAGAEEPYALRHVARGIMQRTLRQRTISFCAVWR